MADGPILPQFPDLDYDDSSSLIMGFCFGALMAQIPGLQGEGLRIEDLDFVHRNDGRIHAIRFHMGSGTYLMTVGKESSALQAHEARPHG